MDEDSLEDREKKLYSRQVTVKRRASDSAHPNEGIETTGRLHGEVRPRGAVRYAEAIRQS
jgi:hypothetical protein